MQTKKKEKYPKTNTKGLEKTFPYLTYYLAPKSSIQTTIAICKSCHLIYTPAQQILCVKLSIVWSTCHKSWHEKPWQVTKRKFGTCLSSLNISIQLCIIIYKFNFTYYCIIGSKRYNNNHFVICKLLLLTKNCYIKSIESQILITKLSIHFNCSALWTSTERISRYLNAFFTLL